MKQHYVGAVRENTSFFCPIRTIPDKELKAAAESRGTTPADLGENLRALRSPGRVESGNIAVHAQDIHDTLLDTGIDGLGDSARFTQAEGGEIHVTALDPDGNEVPRAPRDAGRLPAQTFSCLANIAAGKCQLPPQG